MRSSRSVSPLSPLQEEESGLVTVIPAHSVFCELTGGSFLGCLCTQGEGGWAEGGREVDRRDLVQTN
ncbi:hypothetical protein AAHA92_03291 [Salvia divinorum]|uniref:Uncharacterized protein n=1 Tax=Salvia divinorum TaxID=28513 RepID=A0ABD1IGM0_SALDI